MKKHTASLMTAAMLLTLAWMTGCDSGKTAEFSKAATTTALETTAEVVTDAVETTLYTPPESVQQQWEWKSIMLGQTSYQYEMYSAEKQATVNVLIDMQPSFTNAQEIVDTLTKMGVTAKLIDDGCCLFDQDGSGAYALYGITGDAGENFAATLEYDDALKALRSEFWL